MQNILEPIVLHFRSAQIDNELAAGQPAETSAMHAHRARTLVAPRNRARLAANWEQLLAVAARPPRGLSGRVPIRRASVLEAEYEIRALIDALNCGGPVPAQGVALARQLLTDGSGPVYNRAASDDLGARVAQAASELDPARPLLSPPTPVPKPSLHVG